MIRKAKKRNAAARYFLSEVMDMMHIPEAKRAAATARLWQYRNGRTASAKSKDGTATAYSYEPRLVVVDDYDKIGPTVFYTEAGIEKIRTLLADLSEPIE